MFATVLLALALPVQAAALPTPTPDAADERCLAAFAYLAGDPAQPAAAAEANRYGTLFFYGKLMGRDPGIDLAAGLRVAAGEIAARLPAEIARCRREVEAAGNAMAAAAVAAQRPSPAASAR